MLTLREILSSIIEKNLQPIREVYSQPQIVEITKEIEKQFGRAGNLPTPADLDQMRQVFLSAERDDTWDVIDKKTWKNACWLLWIGDKPLASNVVFLENYIEFCKLHSSPRLVKSIIYAYLRDFKDGMPANDEITSFIREQLHSQRYRALLSYWKKRHDLHLIFDKIKNFGLNARDYIRSTLNANEYLQQMGLEGQLETANYSQEFFKSVAIEIEENIAASHLPIEYFNKLKDLAISREELRYPQNRFLIESLLTPWANKSPPSELSKLILEFLLKYFHDPRTVEGRKNWIGVSEEAFRVVRKWLAGATLEQFFEIIDNTAKDAHWRYRRSFWKAYYDADLIDDAWIALGRDSRLEARTQSVYENELIGATLSGSGVKSDHSVLILKLHDITICEWSHNGKCRIWSEGNKKSPKLYESSYIAEQLREHENFSLPHQRSEYYSWQLKLADYIHEKTGVKMPKYKYEILS